MQVVKKTHKSTIKVKFKKSKPKEKYSKSATVCYQIKFKRFGIKLRPLLRVYEKTKPLELEDQVNRDSIDEIDLNSINWKLEASPIIKPDRCALPEIN